MKAKTLTFIGTCFTVLLWHSGAHAVAAATKRVAPVEASPASKTIQTEFIQAAKDSLLKCGKKYKEYRALQNLHDWSRESRLRTAIDRAFAENRRAELESVPPREVAEPLHKICAENEKNANLTLMRNFIQSYKAEDRSKAKDLAMQWVTSLYAIGEPGELVENAKFDTLLHTLAIDGL